MRAICLSQAPILRCQSLTEVESGVLLIPPGLELILCIGLVMLRGCDRRHVFLASEGFTYFCLALLDLLVHVIPAGSSKLGVFRPLDILTGALSSIPLLLYISFLYAFTASQFIPSLPKQLRVLAKYILMFFLPGIITANAIGSFIGIAYRLVGGVLFVGFTNQAIHTSFDALTLAVLTVYQVLICALASYRLARALRYRQDLAVQEKSGDYNVKAHVFRGLPWLVAGMTLGAVETIIGFAGGGFALALTRRLLRAMSRSCLIVGAFNGVDTVEDFRILKAEAFQQRRRSKLLGLIGNPRDSTFRQLDGYVYDVETGGLRPRQNQNQNRISALASNALDEIRTISIRLSTSPRTSVRPTDTSVPDSSVRPTDTSAPGSSTEALAHMHLGTPLSNTIMLPDGRGIPFPLIRLRDPPARHRHDERVTVHWGDGLDAPHLELRRVSDLLDQPSVKRLTQLGLDPYTQSHLHDGVLEAISLPPHVALEEWAAAQGDHPSLRRFSEEARAKHRSSPVRSSQAAQSVGTSSHWSFVSSRYAPTVEEAEAFATLSTEGSVFSVPSSAIIAPVVRADRAFARHTYGGGRQPQELGRSGDSHASSLELLHALADQFPGTPNTPNWSAQFSQPSHVTSLSMSSDVTIRRAIEQSLARQDSWDARTLPSHSREPSKDVLASSSAANGLPRISEDSTLVGHGGHKKQLSADSQAAATLPTPTSMLMTRPSPPVSPVGQDLHQKVLDRVRKAQTLSARPQPLRMDSIDATETFSDVPPARPRTPRIKSVGSAPKRYTPRPMSSRILTRDSVAVELDSVESGSIQERRRSRTLSRRSKKSSIKSSGKEQRSVVSTISSTPAVAGEHSIFED